MEKRAPVCGSRVIVDVVLDGDGRVAALGQEVKACAFGQASAALMGAHALGRTPEELADARDALAAWLAGSARRSRRLAGARGACPRAAAQRAARRDPAALPGGGGGGGAGCARGGAAMSDPAAAVPLAAGTTLLHDAVILLGFALVFVLVFRRLGLGATLGFLVAGAVVGSAGARPGRRRGEHAALRRARHRAAALPGRAGAEPVAALADAARHFRLRPASGAALRRSRSAALVWLATGAKPGGGARARPAAGFVLDRAGAAACCSRRGGSGRRSANALSRSCSSRTCRSCR